MPFLPEDVCYEVAASLQDEWEEKQAEEFGRCTCGAPQTKTDDGDIVCLNRNCPDT